ncbi:MAG: ABC transporter substrate-binding protein [Flavobacteriales bacterium]|nr:ABC transporter substrate-binding protein [Flavobacteriales bacterium]
MKKNILLLLVLASLTLLGLLYFLNENKKPDEIKVGIFLFTSHKVIDEINLGFKDELLALANKNKLTIKIEEKNANGDQIQLEQITNYFKNGKFDLIFVVGAPAAKMLKDRNVKTPVVFGGIPDPIEMNIVTSLNNHNSNFTGTTYFPPTDKILNLFLESFPNSKKIAVLRNPAEPNSVSVANAFIKNSIKKNIQIVDLPSTDGTQIETSLRTLSINKVDGLFIPTDNLVYSMLDRVIDESKKKNIVTFSCTKLSVEKGALFALGAEYNFVGKESAKVAFPILTKEKTVEETPVLVVNTGNFYVNKKDPNYKKLKKIDGYIETDIQ